MNKLMRAVAQDRRGATAIEFAIIAPVFVLLMLFLFEVSLVLWARGVMQMATSQTARCTAINSTRCTSPGAFASGIIKNWGLSGIVPTIAVTVQGGTACGNTAGQFKMVSISNPGGLSTGFVAPFSGMVMTTTSCYPTGP